MENGTAKPVRFTTVKLLTTPAAEPGPDWPVARLAWGPAWELHWIGLGIGFALIAIHSMIALLMADKSKAFTRRLLFYAVNTLLFILGITRAIYLWIDPYESLQNNVVVDLWLNRVLFGIAFPCLTSSFCLVQVAFLEVAKLKIGSKKLHSLPFVSTVILMHFVIVFVSDITVALQADKKELLIVCQSFFIIWGFLNSFAFLYSGTKIIRKSSETQKQLAQISSSAKNQRDKSRKDATAKVAKVMLITAILGLVCCALQIYSIVGVYGLYSQVVNPAPWPWFSFQTGFRITELAMAWTLAYTVVQPSEYGKTIFKKNCLDGDRDGRRVQMDREGTKDMTVEPMP